MSEAVACDVAELDRLQEVVMQARFRANVGARASQAVGQLAERVDDRRPLGYTADDVEAMADTLAIVDSALGDRAVRLAEAFDLEMNLNRDRSLARACIRELANAVTKATNRAGSEASSAAAELARLRAIERVRSGALGLAEGRRSVDNAPVQDHSFEKLSGPTPLERSWRPPLSISLRVTECVARLLPRTDRQHYIELYQSELAELAQDPRPRQVQLAYTVRVAIRAWSLRRALRAHAPRARSTIW